MLNGLIHFEQPICLGRKQGILKRMADHRMHHHRRESRNETIVRSLIEKEASRPIPCEA